MAKILKCGDVFSGCAAQVSAATVEEVLRQAAEHARTVHKVGGMDDAMVRKVTAAIRES